MCVFVFRKASLALIRKMVHYSSEVLLKEVCDSETGHNLPTVLVEITATVLDQEVHTERIFSVSIRGVKLLCLSWSHCFCSKTVNSLSQDDDDGHLLALQIIRDLVDKGGDVFLDQLARLGVINKVSTLAGPASDDENEDEAKPEKVETRSMCVQTTDLNKDGCCVSTFIHCSRWKSKKYFVLLFKNRKNSGRKYISMYWNILTF